MNIKEHSESLEKMEESSNDDFDAIHDIIDYLVRNESIRFKSQQIGEDDLKIHEKKVIAFDVFKKGPMYFLERYGKYLKLEHLSYFEEGIVGDDKSDLNYLINELKRTLNKNKQKFIVKNRRFEALSKMIEEDSYFSESEMMHRNPLLYEQLVGQYMTEDEKKLRDNVDTENLTLLSLLLERVDRTNLKNELNEQMNKEANEFKELSDDEMDIEEVDEEEVEVSTVRWGEFSQVNKKNKSKSNSKKSKKSLSQNNGITADERDLLREEFTLEMYRSFIDGEDKDFDYQSIDNNEDYDCIIVREKDEEETYFDSETPEEICDGSKEVKEIPDSIDGNEESDDELDIFMKNLNRHQSLRGIISNNDV